MNMLGSNYNSVVKKSHRLVSLNIEGRRAGHFNLFKVLALASMYTLWLIGWFSCSLTINVIVDVVVVN